MSQLQSNESAQISKNVILFSKFYQLLQQASEIFVVCGPLKAGKSVTVDLLTDKTLQKIEDEEDQKKYVAQQNNFSAQYDNIYFQFLQKSKTLVIEGLTLDVQKKKKKSNLIKMFFIKACLQANKNISFVIVLDQTQREQTEGLNTLLEHFLQCLNIKDQYATVNAIEKSIYLLLTKTEEKGAIDQFMQNFEVLQQQATNQGIKNILTKIKQGRRVQMFPNDDPPEDLGIKLRQQFKPKLIEKAALQKLGRIQTSPFLKMLSKSEKEDVINVFERFLNIIKAMANVFVEKSKDNQEYLKAKTNLYEGTLDKELLVQNLKKGFKKLNPKQKINKEAILKQKPQKAYEFCLSFVLTTLKELQSNAELKNQYDYLIGTLLFIKCASPEMDEQLISNYIAKLSDLCRDLQVLYIQNQSPKKQLKQSKQPRQPKQPVQMSKVASKKVVNKAASAFKEEINNLRNNEEVINFIINKIKQKEASDNFQPNDVIYHLKCLRLLLESYDASEKSENRHFIQQLLDLYAFNENLYEFETNLKKYIQKKEIPLSCIQKLIKKADELKSYESQVRLINYAIAHIFDDQEFRFLNGMKELVRIKQHQEYQARCENKEVVTAQKKTYHLSVTVQGIKKKANSNWLSSQSFRKIIETED